MGVNETVFCTVKGFLRDQNKFLVLQLDLGDHKVWDLPGGKVRYEENPNDTLVREVYEETGVKVKPGKPLGTWYFFRQADRNEVVATLFQCDILERNAEIKQTHDGSEHFSDYRWVTKDEFLSDAYPVTHQSLKRLIKSIDMAK